MLHPSTIETLKEYIPKFCKRIQGLYRDYHIVHEILLSWVIVGDIHCLKSTLQNV